MELYLEYFWVIAVITSPILHNGKLDYHFDQKTISELNYSKNLLTTSPSGIVYPNYPHQKFLPVRMSYSELTQQRNSDYSLHDQNYI